MGMGRVWLEGVAFVVGGAVCADFGLANFLFLSGQPPAACSVSMPVGAGLAPPAIT